MGRLHVGDRAEIMGPTSTCGNKTRVPFLQGTLPPMCFLILSDLPSHHFSIAWAPPPNSCSPPSRRILSFKPTNGKYSSKSDTPRRHKTRRAFGVGQYLFSCFHCLLWPLKTCSAPFHIFISFTIKHQAKIIIQRICPTTIAPYFLHIQLMRIKLCGYIRLYFKNIVII